MSFWLRAVMVMKGSPDRLNQYPLARLRFARRAILTDQAPPRQRQRHLARLRRATFSRPTGQLEPKACRPSSRLGGTIHSLTPSSTLSLMQRTLADADPEIAEAIRHETERQHGGLELIASENFVSSAMLEAAGSVLTNKYAEGYPGKRYYGGCEFVDVAESLAIGRAKALFGAEHANVQPHSGAQANMSVYLTLLKPGDTVLGMNLAHGGHLTHGHPLEFLRQALHDRARTASAKTTSGSTTTSSRGWPTSTSRR